jgi:hypothetical protein
MEIEYKLTPSDVIKIQKHQKSISRQVFSLHRSIWGKFLWSILVMIWIAPLVMFLAYLPDGMGYWFLYLIVSPILVVIVAIYVQKKKYYKFLGSALLDDSNRTITITDNGVMATSDNSKSDTSWNRIREIVEFPDYILFVLPLLNCLAIPTRIFNDKSHVAEFISAVHDKKNNFRCS